MSGSQVVWVTVKPHAVGRVLREVAPLMKRDHIIVSAAAGVTIKALEKVILICETVSAVSELTLCIAIVSLLNRNRN